MRSYATKMSGRLIQTTVSEDVLRKFDALAKVGGHRRASYLRHLVELHVRALSPRLAKVTRSTSPLDAVDLQAHLTDTALTMMVESDPRGRKRRK